MGRAEWWGGGVPAAGDVPQSGEAAGTPTLVLVIDDDHTQRQILTGILEREGYTALAVGDGETGLRAIIEHQPQLVLLDLNLPRVDGYEVCRQLRADPLTATLPVMIITAHTALDDMVAALDAGGFERYKGAAETRYFAD